MYKMNESGRNKLYNVSDMCHTTLVFDMACASTFECHCTTFPSRPVLDIFTQKSTYVTHLLLCAMREKEKKKHLQNAVIIAHILTPCWKFHLFNVTI